MKDRLITAAERFRSNKYALFLSYSVAFTGVFLICYSWFLIAHKTVIWEIDGIEQQYYGLLYCGRFFKNLVKGLASGNGFSVPLWDMTIGYGADVLTSVHYYGLGDPFVLLTALVPENHMDKFCFILLFLRLYTAGWGSVVFSRRHGVDRMPAVFGALLYCFSIWGLYYSISQFNFIVPLVWFPYVLNGSDNVLEGKNPLTFIFSLTIAALSNFYFLYMIVILAIGYAVFRYVTEFRPLRIKHAGMTVGRFLLFGAAAMMMSAFILLPVVMVMLTSSRYGAGKEVSILYPLRFYLQIFSAFAGDSVPASWTGLGFGFGLPSVVLLFTLKGQYRRLKIAFAVLSLCLCIPFGGLVLNGFAYVTNRWVWCYGLLISFITARMIPHFRNLSMKQKQVLTISAFIYIIINCLTKVTRTEEGVAIVMLYAAEILLLLVTSDMSRPVVNVSVALCIIIGIFTNAYYWFSDYGDNGGVKSYLYFHEANKILNAYDVDSLTADDDTFYRIDDVRTSFARNSGSIRGKMTTGFYLSMTAPYVPEFILENGLNVEKTYMFRGLGNRSILQKLLGIKYLYVKDGFEEFVTDGFHNTGKTVDANGDIIHLYESDHASSLGFMMPSYVKRNSWADLTMPQKQTVLLNSVVIEDKDTADVIVPEADIEKVSDSSVSILQNIEENENVEIRENKIFVKKPGASIKIKINPVNNSELYVILKGLDFDNYSNEEEYSESEWDELSVYEKALVRDEDFLEKKETSSNIGASVGNDMERYTSVNFMNRKNNYFCGQTAYMLSLGDFENTGDTVRIHFQKTGIYDFSDIDVVAEPLENIERSSENIEKEKLEDVQIGLNAVTGSINTEKDGLLFLSIPYSTGWKAYVDGEETNIYQADVAFMALNVKAGTHQIELKYMTPFLKEGIALSIGGVFVTLLTVLYFVKKRKRIKEQTNYEG